MFSNNIIRTHPQTAYEYHEEDDESNAVITSKDTNWLVFKDNRRQQEYHSFRCGEFNATHYSIFLFFYFLLIADRLVTSSNSVDYSFFAVLLSLTFFVLLSGVFLIPLQLFPNFVFFQHPFISFCTISDIFMLFSGILWSFSIFERAYFKEPRSNCNSDICNMWSLQDTQYLPFLIISLIQNILKSCQWWTTFFSWLILTISVIISISGNTHNNPSYLSLLFALGSYAILHQYEASTLSRYIASTNHKMVSESRSRVFNRSVVAAQQTVELRHLIASVAHDLKTPLQAFGLCLESLQSQIMTSDTHLDPNSGRVGGGHIDVQQTEDTIETLRTICSFMSMTINRSIDFTKSSHGIKLVPSPEIIDLAECLNWPLKCVRGMQARVPIELDPLPPNLSPLIITDKQWLQENVLCLVSNAAKFTIHGSVRIGCRLEMTPEQGRGLRRIPSIRNLLTQVKNTQSFLRIEVEDTGIGIGEEDMKKLFQPFRQAQRLAGGTGLGLYSLAKRMEALGGSCGVSSRPDGKPGTLFWFCIPYKPDEASSTASSGRHGGDDSVQPFTEIHHRSQHKGLHYDHNPAYSPAGLFAPTNISKTINSMARISEKHLLEESKNDSIRTVNSNSKRVIIPKLMRGGSLRWKGQNLRILVVDDSIAILKTTSKLLEQSGHQVDVAENGAIALEKLKNDSFSVILLDLQMPVMDGFETVKRIRQTEKMEIMELRDMTSPRPPNVGRKTPQVVIGMSANSDAQTQQDALDAGMDLFIPKPFTSKKLTETLRNFDFLSTGADNSV